MTATTNDEARRHGGWQRRMQDREALRRTAAREPVVTQTAEAQWLDDGGAAEERSDGVSFRDVR